MKPAPGGRVTNMVGTMFRRYACMAYLITLSVWCHFLCRIVLPLVTRPQVMTNGMNIAESYVHIWWHLVWLRERHLCIFLPYSTLVVVGNWIWPNSDIFLYYWLCIVEIQKWDCYQEIISILLSFIYRLYCDWPINPQSPIAYTSWPVNVLV